LIAQRIANWAPTHGSITPRSCASMPPCRSSMQPRAASFEPGGGEAAVALASVGDQQGFHRGCAAQKMGLPSCSRGRSAELWNSHPARGELPSEPSAQAYAQRTKCAGSHCGRTHERLPFQVLVRAPQAG
jgi:hypothetical protein